ncbi:MAG: hypothetical protein V3U74_02020 [Thermodesulfobacteriota bacterium]
MDFGMGTVLAIAAAIVVVLILRSRSTMDIKAPDVDTHATYSQAPEPVDAPGDAKDENWPEEWGGTYKGVEYYVISYDGQTMTVEISIPKMLPKTLEVNARIERPNPSESEFANEINALINLGANYIDLSYNTTRVAAEVPIDQTKVDRKLAERIVDHLIRLRDLASGATASPMQ